MHQPGIRICPAQCSCTRYLSQVVRNNLNPSFLELLRLPVQLPILYDNVTISVSDYDQGGYDDLVADTTLSLNAVVKKGQVEPYWIPLYGIKGSTGLQTVRDKLPHVPLNTCYKGRLLLALMVEPVADRLAPKVKSIGPCSDPPSEPFCIRFDLLQASQLDERSVPDNTQISVELQVGGLTLVSSTGLAEHGAVRWDEMFEEATPMLPSDLAQCPDIFINVNYTTVTAEKEERLGYIQLDLEDVNGFNHAPRFETLLRDPLYPNVSAVPGFLEYRLDFGKLKDMPKSARERITQPPMRKFELRAHIYQALCPCRKIIPDRPKANFALATAVCWLQCTHRLSLLLCAPPRRGSQARNLPSMDEDGLANPYTVVTLQGFAGQTRVTEPTCNPLWYETVRVELQLPQPTPINTNILLRVYDMEAGDTVGGDQLIGKCYVPLLGVDKAFPPRPEWVPIFFDDPSDTRGELLCSFQLIAMEEMAKVPLNDITPPMRDVEVEVNVVGVRDLLAYNNAPIGAPFVEFDAGDRSTSDKIRATRPSSQPSGPDANFLETLVIHTRLPEDLIFCPSLNVRVFDYRGPDNTPVVGKVSIPLAPYCEWITEAEYVPMNRPRVPLYKISDDMSETSDDDERDIDVASEAYKATIPTNLFDANFSFATEVRLDTPSLAEIRSMARKGKFAKGARVRTLPSTAPTTPYGIPDAEADEESKIDLPLEAELEHLIIDPAFDEWQVYRGFGAGTGGAARREVGRFKARLRVVEADLKSKALPRLDLVDLFEQSVYITRLYVTRGIKVASRDSDGLADPFLVISNGRHRHNIIDDVKHTQLDTINPNFYRCYELPTMVPGNPTLTIEVWDKDMGGAQLIGSTSIDLESRLLSQEWIEMVPKPVERRYLWSPASLAPQGKLEMWVEVLTPQQALASKPKALRAPSALDCELRVIVWGVHDLEIKGKTPSILHNGTADCFVTVTAGNSPMQESDIHQGVVDHAEVNWRFLFDVQQPTRHTKLTVQIWDQEYTGANDSLAEVVLQLKLLYKNVERSQGRIHEVPRQFYAMTHPLFRGQQGKIDMSIYMMPRRVAEEFENIAGIGRGAPNQNPYLPPPVRASQLLPSARTGLTRLRRGKSEGGTLGFSPALPETKGGAGGVAMLTKCANVAPAPARRGLFVRTKTASTGVPTVASSDSLEPSQKKASTLTRLLLRTPGPKARETVVAANAGTMDSNLVSATQSPDQRA